MRTEVTETKIMAKLPEIKAYSFSSEEQTFPSGERAVLLLSFDKLHYPMVLEWHRDLLKSSSMPIYNIPLLSDRFMLMQDILFEGIRAFFRDIEEQTKPAFVNRIKFFDNTGLDEDSPAIVIIDANGECEFYKDIEEIKDLI